MPFNVQYICATHGKFEVLFSDSSKVTPSFPCVYDDYGISHDVLDPAPHCRKPAEKDEIGNLPRHIKTDQGWEGGIATPRGVFDTKQKYLEALAATGSLPREAGMDKHAKRAREYKDEEGQRLIHNRVAQTYQELNQGRKPFVPSISADDPLNYGFDKE